MPTYLHVGSWPNTFFDPKTGEPVTVGVGETVELSGKVDHPLLAPVDATPGKRAAKKAAPRKATAKTPEPADTAPAEPSAPEAPQTETESQSGEETPA